MNHGFLKQSTASQSRLVGPFLDDTDFKTAETGLTIANTDVKLSANGGAGSNKNSGGGTHRNNGMYSLTFDATDTATVGELGGSIVVSGALPVVFKFLVLEEAIYDALFAASAAGFDANQRVKADVERWLTGTPNALSSGRVEALAGALSSGVITATSIASDAITAAKVAADVSSEIADQVWDEAIAGHSGAGSTGKALIDDLAHGTPPTAAAIADAVWDEATSGHTTGGTFGEQLKTDVDAVLADTNELQTDWVNGGRLDLLLDAVKAVTDVLVNPATIGTAVWATGTRVLTAATNIVGGIADQVWDELLSGHTTTGSAGKVLADGGGGGGGGIAGPGALTKTIRILISGSPVQGVSVWVSTDAGGSEVIAGPLITDSFGVVTVLVDAGTYYVWARKDGMTAILANSITVS